MGIPNRFAGQQWHPSTRIDRLHDTTKKRTGARRNDRFLMFSVVKPPDVQHPSSDLRPQFSVIRDPFSGLGPGSSVRFNPPINWSTA